MADNVGVTPGVGATFATDDIGGIQYPRVKMTQGADGAAVDVSSAAPLQVTLANGTVPSHAVTNAGTFASQENGAALTALQLIDDTITSQGTALGTTKTSLIGGSVTTASPTYTTGQISPLSLDTTGAVRVNVTAGGGAGGTSSNFGSAFPTPGTAAGFSDGTNMVAGRVKAASTAPVATDPSVVVTMSPNAYDFGSGTAGTKTQRVIVDSSQLGSLGQAVMASSAPVAIASNQSTIPVGPVPVTTGGLSMNSYLIASGTNATNVKASAGQIYKIEIFNNSANIGYLKIYNTAGTPTAGSGTPVMRIMVPGSASGAGAISTTDMGITLGTGIGFTFTGGIADADTTSVAASSYIVNFYYK